MINATTRTLALCALAQACLLVSCDSPLDGDDAPADSVESAVHVKGPRRATATIRDAAGNVLAFVTLHAHSDGATTISVRGTLAATLEGFHGFHVHANDNPANGEGCIADPAQPPATHFVSADAHLVLPDGTHGHHAGDLPPLLVRGNGRASLEVTTDRFKVADAIGRAFILHQNADNFGNVPVGVAANQYTANSPDAITLTEGTGNAGPRIGCGVIH
jgi:Cu-Zn family superoxide dismutase